MDKYRRLKECLEKVSDTYQDFVIGGLREAKHDSEYADKIIKYVQSHPSAKTSDIIKYETEEIFGIKPVS